MKMDKMDYLRLFIAIIPNTWLLISIGELNIPSHIANRIVLVIIVVWARLIPVKNIWHLDKDQTIQIDSFRTQQALVAWSPLIC